MTDREICERIRNRGCVSCDEVWCSPRGCPLHDGEIRCYDSAESKYTAEAWIDNDEKQKERETMKPFKVQVTPEQSKELQEALFAVGKAWWSGSTKVTHTNEPFLFCDRDGITHTVNYRFFRDDTHRYDLLHFHEALERVKTYKPADVVVTCNGKKTTLSYKDAKTLNLV